ncbi:hypothetical protein SSS_03249 [Sarcoptes scabiei]|nr:hypothetical protein SSS_03249 [Sarcoptes scabiei]
MKFLGPNNKILFLVLLIQINLFIQIGARGWFGFGLSDTSTTDNELDDEEIEEDDIPIIREVAPIEWKAPESASYENEIMNENARDSDEKSYPMKSSNDPNQMNEGGSSVEYQPGDHNGHPRYDDPSDRTCSEGQFMCRKVSPDQPHVRCIPNDWRCNGVRDCEESDDEEQCDSDSLQTGHYSHMHSSYSQSHHHHQQHQMDPYGQHQKISEQSSCEPNQYQCYGTGVHDTPAKCIDRSLLCDKNNDCAYGDDERMCQDGKYVGEQQEQYRQGVLERW